MPPVNAPSAFDPNDRNPAVSPSQGMRREYSCRNTEYLYRVTPVRPLRAPVAFNLDDMVIVEDEGAAEVVPPQASADIIRRIKECRRKAEDDACLDLFFSPGKKLTCVDASAFSREELTVDELFSTEQHLAWVAPARSGKSPAITYGILRDLEERRPVMLFTCQASDNSYQKAVDGLREHFKTLDVPASVEFFTFEDVRNPGRIERILAAFREGRPLVLCLRFCTEHMRPLVDAKLKLHPGTAIYMDEPQNKWTFKKAPAEAAAEAPAEAPAEAAAEAADEDRFVKLAIGDIHKLGVKDALLRTVSATQMDSLHWLTKVCGPGAVMRVLREDAAKLKERNFCPVHENYEAIVIPAEEDNLNSTTMHGLCVAGKDPVNSNSWHEVVRSATYSVFESPPPSEYYGYYLLEGGAYMIPLHSG